MRDITMAVYEFMVKENIQERLQRTEEEFQKAGELALAKEYSQVYRIIIELFDKFVELLGEEPVGLNEYCKLLDAGLEEARVGVIPPSVDSGSGRRYAENKIKRHQGTLFSWSQ